MRGEIRIPESSWVSNVFKSWKTSINANDKRAVTGNIDKSQHVTLFQLSEKLSFFSFCDTNQEAFQFEAFSEKIRRSKYLRIWFSSYFNYFNPHLIRRMRMYIPCVFKNVCSILRTVKIWTSKVFTSVWNRSIWNSFGDRNPMLLSCKNDELT